MSAKNRKTPQAVLPHVDMANPLNYYSTEADAVRAIVPHLRAPGWQSTYVQRAFEASRTVTHPPPATWIDAGCGRGEIASVLRAEWPRARGCGVEIDPARAEDARVRGVEVVEGDWLFGPDRDADLRKKFAAKPDVILTNGPFDWPDDEHKAHRKGNFGDMWAYWANVCRTRVHPAGEVAALGRLGVLQAQQFSPRDCLFEGDDIEGAPKWDLYVLGWRLSFTGNGKTDSQPCGWFVFGPTRTRTIHRLHRPVARERA